MMMQDKTRLSCCRWNWVICCISPTMWLTKLFSECDKQVTVVGQLLTTLVIVNMLWQNFSKTIVWDKVPKGSTRILGNTKISLKHNVD